MPGVSHSLPGEVVNKLLDGEASQLCILIFSFQETTVICIIVQGDSKDIA